MALAAHQIATFNIKSIVLSIADDAINNDLEIIAENIFPKTRIYQNELLEKQIINEKEKLSYNVGKKCCFNKYKCPSFMSFDTFIMQYCTGCMSLMYI